MIIYILKEPYIAEPLLYKSKITLCNNLDMKNDK